MTSLRQHGATLLELMIALALIAVLAGIGAANYRAYVLRAHRTEARAALLALATTEEAFYLQCNTYAATLDATSTNACSPASLSVAAVSERGYYSLAVMAADTAAWTATATAVSGAPQYADDKCRVFRLTSQGTKTASDADGVSSGSVCWAQ